MAELVGGAVLGAVVGAALTAVIEVAKKAWRCRNDCVILAGTVDSARPHVEAFKDLESPSCQDWLQQLKVLLDEAKDVMEKYCVWNSKRWMVSRVFYKRNNKLSMKILDINERIKSKVGEGQLLIQNHGITLAIYDQNTMILQELDKIKNDKTSDGGSSNYYVPRVLPSNIVCFENDPFQELKSLIISKCDLKHPLTTLGLIGCGGVGKTLVAMMLHNDDDIKAKYGEECVLWVTVGRDANLSQVYKKISKILSISIVDKDLDDQFTFLMNALQKRRVLMIFDDVWDEIIGGKSLIEWLNVAKGEGSVTLVTTRSREVLRTARVHQSISIPLLSLEKSWELFCSHAFGSDVPTTHEIGEIANEVCKKCGGLPLALEVIGASMYGKGDVLRWKHALGKLSHLQGKDKVLEKLKYSYEEVEKEEQKLFLYFAAFPEDCEVPTRILCSIWHAEQSDMIHGGIESVYLEGMEKLFNLADRSLIKLSKNGEVATIHDILRELAMDIIDKTKSGEFYFHPGKDLKGLPLPIPMNVKRMSLIGSSLCGSLDEYNQGDLEVLLLSGLHVIDTESLRRQLGTRSKILLRNTKLRFLDISKTNLENLPEAIGKLRALMYLDLSDCESLENLREDIIELGALISLDLSRCGALEKLPEGMGKMKALISLDLKWCNSLHNLPEDIVELEALTSLNLSRCGALEKLPEGMGKMKALTTLDLSYCESLHHLPEDIVELQALTSLNLAECGGLEKLPDGMGKMKALTSLNLRWCKSLHNLPEDIMELETLISWDLLGCVAVEKLIEGMRKMKALTSLNLSWCKSLHILPKDIVEMGALLSLDLSECGALEKLPQGMGKMKALTTLDLSYCESLQNLPEDIVELGALTSLNLSGCGALEKLPEGMGKMKALTSLNLTWCKSLHNLPEDIMELGALISLDLLGCVALEKLLEGMGKMKALTTLNLTWCKSLHNLPEDIVEMGALVSLDFSECGALEKLPDGMGKMKALTSLNLSWCKSLHNLPEDIMELGALVSLDLSYCECLEKLPEGMGKMKALTSLNLSWCKSLHDLPEDIMELEALTFLNLSGCRALEKLLEGMGKMKALTSLNLRWCKSLHNLPEDIVELGALVSLDLLGCVALEKLPEGMGKMKALTSLNLSWCKSLHNLPEDIVELGSLVSLDLSECGALEKLPKGMGKMKALSSLKTHGCSLLNEKETL